MPRPQRPDSERRLRQNSRLARSLRILELIQGKGRWTAREIAMDLGCSERTVYRDLGALELAGVPWFFDEQERSYRVRTGFRFPPVNLSEDELIGLATATSMTSAAGLDIGLGARPTAEKVAGGSGERERKLLADADQLISVLGLKLADHSQARDAVRSVQLALVRRKQVVGRYRSPYEPKPVKLTLHPYRLCLVRQAWYVIGRAANDADPKTYRVTRFESLKLTDAPATVPEEFDLKDYFGNAWGAYRGTQSYRIELLFTPEAAPLVTETVWHATQQVKRHKDGSAALAFTVEGLDEILGWLLSWAGRVRVEAPTELRQMMSDRLCRGLAMNRL